MKFKFFIVCCFIFGLTASAALAETLTSGNYTVKDTITSGGQQLTSGNYSVYDLKGQAAAGELTSGNYTLQLGGIYQLLGAATPTTGIPLTISRTSDGKILLGWTGWTGADPDIWFYATNYSGTTTFMNRYYITPGGNTQWAPVTPGTTAGFGPINYKTMVVDDTPELMFFKALPAGTTIMAGVTYPAGTSPFELAPTVGKVNIKLNTGISVVSVPFSRTDNDISAVFGADQLSGATLYTKPSSDNPNTSRYRVVNGAWVDDQNQPAAMPVQPELGYWINVPGTRVLKVWGNVIKDTSRSLTIKDGGISVVGCVYPNNELFLSAGLNSAGGSKNKDVIYYKPSAASPNTQKLTFNGTDWQCADPNESKKFTVPFGYWYNREAGNGDYNLVHLKTY